MREQKIDEMAAHERRFLAHVRSGELTRKEGAVGLAGAWLKTLLASGRPDAGINREVLLRQARLALDSQLPDFRGLSFDRHF